MRWLCFVGILLLAGCVEEPRAQEDATHVTPPHGNQAFEEPASPPRDEGLPSDPACEPMTTSRSAKIEHSWTFPDDGNMTYVFVSNPGDENITVSVTTNTTGVGFLIYNHGKEYFFVNATAPNGTTTQLQGGMETVFMPDAEAGMEESPAQWYTRYLTPVPEGGAWQLRFDGRGSAKTTVVVKFEDRASDC